MSHFESTSKSKPFSDSVTKPTDTERDDKAKKEEKERKKKKEQQEEAYRKISVDDVWLKVDNSVMNNPPSLADEPQRTGWHTVRIFVSSTFRDFHSERDVLVKKV